MFLFLELGKELSSFLLKKNEHCKKLRGNKLNVQKLLLNRPSTIQVNNDLGKIKEWLSSDWGVHLITILVHGLEHGNYLSHINSSFIFFYSHPFSSRPFVPLDNRTATYKWTPEKMSSLYQENQSLSAYRRCKRNCIDRYECASLKPIYHAQ